MVHETTMLVALDGHDSVRVTNPLTVARIEGGEIFHDTHGRETALSERAPFYGHVRELQILYICARNLATKELDARAALEWQIKRVERLIGRI